MAIRSEFPVGIYTLREAQTFTKQYECAAWHKEIEVPAGAYPVYALYEGQGATRRLKDFTVELPGTIRAASFPSLFCGNPIGDGKAQAARDAEEIGKPESFHIFVRGYEVLLGVNDPASRWAIDRKQMRRLDIWIEDCACGRAKEGTAECVKCSIRRRAMLKRMAQKRFPRLIARLRQCEIGMTYLAAETVADAAFQGSLWHRREISKALATRRRWLAAGQPGKQILASYTMGVR